MPQRRYGRSALETTREEGCRLVTQVAMSEADGFDCTYSEWVTLFREDVLHAAEKPMLGATPSLSDEQVSAAAEAEGAHRPLILEDGHRIEQTGVGWIICDESGDVMIDLESNTWSVDSNGEDVPALAFSTPAAALTAFLHSQILAQARAERYEAALRKLERL